jgi:hypothetical protein
MSGALSQPRPRWRGSLQELRFSRRVIAMRSAHSRSLGGRASLQEDLPYSRRVIVMRGEATKPLRW